jgi:hypothetical protein
VGYAGFGITMPITAPGPEQSELKGNVRETSTKVRVMAWMARLYRVEPLAFEPLDEASSSPFLQVSNGNQATGSVDQFRDIPELGKCFLHECRTAAAQEAVKRFTQICRPAVADDGACHMGTANCPAGGFLENTLEREIHSKSLQVLNHFLGSAHPIGPAALEKCLNLLRLGWQKIPQDVHLSPG